MCEISLEPYTLQENVRKSSLVRAPDGKCKHDALKCISNYLNSNYPQTTLYLIIV